MSAATKQPALLTPQVDTDRIRKDEAYLNEIARVVMDQTTPETTFKEIRLIATRLVPDDEDIAGRIAARCVSLRQGDEQRGHSDGRKTDEPGGTSALPEKGNSGEDKTARALVESMLRQDPTITWKVAYDVACRQGIWSGSWRKFINGPWRSGKWAVNGRPTWHKKSPKHTEAPIASEPIDQPVLPLQSEDRSEFVDLKTNWGTFSLREETNGLLVETSLQMRLPSALARELKRFVLTMIVFGQEDTKKE